MACTSVCLRWVANSGAGNWAGDLLVYIEKILNYNELVRKTPELYQLYNNLLIKGKILDSQACILF